MEFEWDEAKSNACLARCGFDFAYAVRVFLDPNRLVEIDDRFDYGETRYRVLGQIEGRAFLIVYTPRRGKLRMGRMQFKLEADGTLWRSGRPQKPIRGRIDAHRVDATTEADIARHAAGDDAAAKRRLARKKKGKPTRNARKSGQE